MASKFIKTVLALLTFILTFINVIEAQNRSNAYRVDTFTPTSAPALELRTSGGSLEVIGHDENEIVIETYVRRGSRYLDTSDTDLSDFDLEIYQDGDLVRAEATRDGSGFSILRMSRNISISFRAYVPVHTEVNGSTSGGSVSARNLMNDIDLRTSGGSVSVVNIHGNAVVRTSGGGITIEDFAGMIEARTSGGSISVDGLEGVGDLRTSGGSIRMDNIAAKLDARTSGGSIRANLLSLYDDVNLQTSGGSIRIDLNGATDFELNLRGNRVNTQLRNFSGEFENNRIVGKIGDGGPQISARTSGGSVSLNY